VPPFAGRTPRRQKLRPLGRQPRLAEPRLQLQRAGAGDMDEGKIGIGGERALEPGIGIGGQQQIDRGDVFCDRRLGGRAQRQIAPVG
jgi:hypothetical protein